MSAERMAWTWIDPFGVRHAIDKYVGGSPFATVNSVTYKTLCDFDLTVDDVNKKTMTNYQPTCISCIAALDRMEA